MVLKIINGEDYIVMEIMATAMVTAMAMAMAIATDIKKIHNNILNIK